MNTNFCMERNLNYDEFFSHSYTSSECAQTGERKRGKNWSKKGLGEKCDQKIGSNILFDNSIEMEFIFE